MGLSRRYRIRHVIRNSSDCAAVYISDQGSTIGGWNGLEVGIIERITPSVRGHIGKRCGAIGRLDGGTAGVAILI